MANVRQILLKHNFYDMILLFSRRPFSCEYYMWHFFLVVYANVAHWNVKWIQIIMCKILFAGFYKFCIWNIRKMKRGRDHYDLDHDDLLQSK